MIISGGPQKWHNFLRGITWTIQYLEKIFKFIHRVISDEEVSCHFIAHRNHKNI